jgi:hypothetical protein
VDLADEGGGEDEGEDADADAESVDIDMESAEDTCVGVTGSGRGSDIRGVRIQGMYVRERELGVGVVGAWVGRDRRRRAIIRWRVLRGGSDRWCCRLTRPWNHGYCRMNQGRTMHSLKNPDSRTRPGTYNRFSFTDRPDSGPITLATLPYPFFPCRTFVYFLSFFPSRTLHLSFLYGMSRIYTRPDCLCMSDDHAL